MDSRALALEVRNALDLADELSRHEHAIGNSPVTGNLRSLETTLADADRHLGRSDEHAIEMPLEIIETTRRAVDAIARRRGDMPLYLHARFDELVASGHRVVFGLARPFEAVPSKPVAGMPIKRVVPQDLHSILDYVSAATTAASAVVARTNTARVAGTMLAVTGATTSAATDYRLALTRTIPIETHEKIDIGWGLTSILAPFVLGYAKKDPFAASLQIFAGIATIATSLFTDYRAERGLTRPRRSRGGPEAGNRKIRVSRTEISDAPRPLEGLSSVGDAPPSWTYDR